MNVVCAILIQRGRVLLAQRPSHKNKAHHWEFPGGKVSTGETEPEALSRELLEELKLSIPKNCFQKLGELEDKNLKLHFYYHFLTETFSPQEHRALGWFEIKDLGHHKLCPLDQKACEVWQEDLKKLLTHSLIES